MKSSVNYFFIFIALCCGTMSCGNSSVDGEPAVVENVFRGPDWEDQSARSEYTDQTSDPTTDPLKDGTESNWVEPKYTDDEYEAAYSTSSTNPKNQIHKLPEVRE